MKDFIRVASVTPNIKLGKPIENVKIIADEIKKANDSGAKIIATPELSLTGYTISDLFFQSKIIEDSFKALLALAKITKKLDCFFTVGLPVYHNNLLFNSVAAINHGKILGIVPKTYLPNSKEYYEKRWFNSGKDLYEQKSYIQTHIEDIPFGTNLIFQLANNQEIKIGIEICEDLFAPIPPSTNLALQGATIILNSSASIETLGKDEYRRNLVKMQSGATISAYVYSNAGAYESSQDAVFSGHNIIAENGQILNENELFTDKPVFADIDLTAILYDRKVISSFRDMQIREQTYYDIRKELFSFNETSETNEVNKFFDKKISQTPFVPEEKTDIGKRAKEILDMQARGIIKRLESSGTKKLVIGLSGGLDSTLAFLATIHAFSKLSNNNSTKKKSRKDIIAITMPAFGTTKRTKSNAIKLAESFGVTLKEIDISKTTRSHFSDIKHNENDHNTTYENAQARIRTLTLFDIANKENGLVIGTGDLSELALGWATYGGDHLSSYGVNSGIPKTLVKYVIEYYMDNMALEINENFKNKNKNNEKLLIKNIKNILQDILDTPVSPELLPPDKNGKISQKTEDLVGPYLLHDFFLYHFLRYGRKKEQIFELATYAFKNTFTKQVIKKWLDNFYKRFYANQFKRSCLPDGLKVGSVSLSPRADFRMPSDL